MFTTTTRPKDQKSVVKIPLTVSASSNSSPLKPPVVLRKPIYGYEQPVITIAGLSEQGKTGIALTAAALNPDMSAIDGCPRGFDKLFEITNTSRNDDEREMRRIEPIEQVIIADGERDSNRLFTYFKDLGFPDQMLDKISIADMYEQDKEFSVSSAIENFENVNKYRDIQSNRQNCIIYDSLSGYIGNLNTEQKNVSRKHAEEVERRRQDYGAVKATKVKPAILSNDALAKITQKDWEWRNEHADTFMRNVKGWSAMTITTTSLKPLYVDDKWDNQTYIPAIPANFVYLEDIRISIKRANRKVEVTINKNRPDPTLTYKSREFDLNCWTLANILIWSYGLDKTFKPY